MGASLFLVQRAESVPCTAGSVEQGRASTRAPDAYSCELERIPGRHKDRKYTGLAGAFGSIDHKCCVIWSDLSIPNGSSKLWPLRRLGAQGEYGRWLDELGCESQLVDLHGNVALIAATRKTEALGRL